MLDSLRDSFEMLRDQVWFFRFFVIMSVVCVYRALLHFVLRSNHCPNPFCSKCLGSGSVRGRAINHIKQEQNSEDDSLSSIVLNNLMQHDRLCHKNDEKPTVYFHRGLSSNEGQLADQKLIIEQYAALRQETVKYFQDHESVTWTHLNLYENGEENAANCKAFPKLFEVLQTLPNAICINNPKCIFGNCFLTRLPSDEVQQNASGSTNGCIRMHVGLMCDEQSPAYVLLNQRRRLPIKNEGAVSYNHALPHSIENPTEKQQVYLSVDFWHPDLSAEMRKHITSIFHTDLV